MSEIEHAGKDELTPDDDLPRTKPGDAEDEERVYYQGTPLLRGELGMLFGWLVAGTLLIALGILLGVVFDTGLPWWGTAIFVVLGLACYFFPGIWIKRTHYRVTSYRIDFERGLFSKSIDTLELWHVDDISFRQSFVDRIFRVGTIQVISGDNTTPSLELKSLPEPRKLFEQLKQRVISVKRQRGVIKMDMGGGGGFGG